MTDVMTAAQRSRCMSRIRGRDTKPEIALRSALWRCGLRFRKNGRLRGKPDIVFPTERIAVFVDGCFWHRCPQHQTRPASNAEFWDRKLSENVERDRRTEAILGADGWIVLRVWEHEVEDELEDLARRIRRLVARRRSTSRGAEGRLTVKDRPARDRKAR
jgi:DNA mismatch endonuclease (patch repair protein)